MPLFQVGYYHFRIYLPQDIFGGKTKQNKTYSKDSNKTHEIEFQAEKEKERKQVSNKFSKIHVYVFVYRNFSLIRKLP